MSLGIEPIEVKKRLEEVRLLESRRSARLADQDRDTDFARLADMGGDRRRTSNSIEITPQQNSRKRPPSYQEEEMNECNAALILMNLSNSPKSPKNGEKWLGSSPGSSSASWSSGSSSPPLSDDGHATNTSINDASARIRTTSVSTSDEGIVVDFIEEAPRKKRASKTRFKCTWKGCKTEYIDTQKKIEQHVRTVHLGNKKARRSTDCDGLSNESDHEEEFYYTEIEDDDDEGSVVPSPTSPPTLSHRDMARPPHEDPEYQRQIVGNFKQGRVATSHQNPHNGRTVYHVNAYNSNNHHQQQQQLSNSCTPASPLAHHNYTWSPSNAAATVTIATTSPTQQQQQHSPTASPYIKHARSSTRPSQSAAPYPTQPYVHHQHQQQHHHHPNESGSHSNSNNNTIIHSNSSANNVLQQLSQQNVTVTAHHSGSNITNGNQQQQHQHHQMTAVTITPNYHGHHQHQQQQQHHHQQHIRGNSGGNGAHQQQQQQQTPHNVTASNIAAIQHTTNANNSTSPHMHQQQQHHPPQHVAVQHAVVTAAKHTPNSPNRRTRGENKKCRKVYGMERREQWCTQCRWKKACSRFGD